MKQLAKIVGILICVAAGIYAGREWPSGPVPKVVFVPKETAINKTLKKQTFPQKKSLPPLQLTLLGTVIDSGSCLAWIKDTSTGFEGYYEVGDRIKDALFIKIESGKTELRRKDGSKETIEIEKVIAEERTIKAKEFISRYQNLNNILKEISFSPEIFEGKIRGLRLDKIKEGSIEKKFGFKEGDIIREINGYTFNGLKEAAAFYRRLKKEYTRGTMKDIEIGLERNGKKEILTFSIE